MPRFPRTALFLLALFAAPVAFAQDPCVKNTANPSVTICEPAAGATVASPFRVVALTTSSSAVNLMQVYLDGAKVFEALSDRLDTQLSAAEGAHRLTVQARNNNGTWFKQSINITVSAVSTGCQLKTADPSVTICQPANGSTQTSPVRVVAETTSSTPVDMIQAYVDGAKVFEAAASRLDTPLAMTPGTHRLTVQARTNGVWFKDTVNITVRSETADLSRIQHIIFYMQENRSFDQYFGRLGQYRRDRGATDPIAELPLNVALPDTAGHLIRPYHLETVCHENLSPGWNESWYSYNNGQMNNFLKASKSVPSTIDPHGTRAMGYYDWTDIPYYYELAFRFATSDTFYASALAPTIPNRMYLYAGTSFGHIRPDAAPAGGWQQRTIFDALTEAGISWKYYFQDNSVYLSQWDTWNRDSGKVVNIEQYYADLQNGTLPSVVFIEQAAKLGLNEHPGTNIQRGVANTKKLIDALMQSSAWESSAFILLFDEAGGFYDHVPPPTAPKPDNIAPLLRSTDIAGNFERLGFRVPFIVISPWVKPQHVSHVTRDITSVLKFIQTRFGLPPLTARDAWADDMTELFDFSNPAWLTPPPLPPQPVNGVCDKTRQNAPGH